MTRLWAWAAFLAGLAYMVMPLIGMTEFSLRMRRGVYSLDAYASVLNDPKFQETFSYSVVMAIFTIAFGILLVVPTAYWVRLRMPGLRPYVEFITLLPPASKVVLGMPRRLKISSARLVLAEPGGPTRRVGSIQRNGFPASPFKKASIALSRCG